MYQVAIAKLRAAGAIDFDTSTQPPKLVLKEMVPSSNDLEALVLAVAKKSGTVADLATDKVLVHFKEKLEAGLVVQKLMLSTSQRLLVGVCNLAIFSPLLLVGFFRLLIGVSLHRNVEHLGVLLAASALLCFINVVLPERRSSAGFRHLDRAVRDNAALKTTLSASDSQLQINDIAMAAAIFGVGTLGTAYWPAELSATSSSGCGSSCGSSCGGGCGGGGG